ncbi:glucose-1-phosphate cytidylyltransferase [Clostridium botulinum]|uniref:Glucose-1-phosphate cytidylyltransferase n=2 Tax=Clostridium TaxID=1485 RepID=B2TRV3_CLOBB|nr:glucose-1-phosphate cytidylyltransferase [Clostridium botulinum B str. Eklund 17B (NRP)]MBY6975858.1 glucose-1-phosphate cytidylyltransferase [Clostridium botulinum]MBY7000281.1 glucose-1-phosphate cytidylyltransferase [Clostridium botulinum]MCR1273040.1 glucose-1-phosphate cytidylyltransferase [Clostridium botulinum]NFD70146.1 glucose-1-phosphate cytidylyltransferase [Clostridium botulinum]
MKVVILAGGYGTRISEESHLRPKPMIEIGGNPILWHIMKGYSYYGFNEFIICCGYKGHMIKEYFANYYIYSSDITFEFPKNNKISIHSNIAEPWKVTLVDTGIDTMTGGRLKRVQKYVGDETFMLTYGDGVSDININNLLEFHKQNNKIATLTAIQPEARFGIINIDEDNRTVTSFDEKSKENGSWINGGYMVLEPKIFEYIKGDNTFLEKEPMENLAKDKMLNAYKHSGFWKCMDTQRDKELLEKLWRENNAKWKVWD